MPARTIAIGDIHGCSAALEAILEAIQPRPDDTLVTLGDYVNRGPDSRGVLDRLIDLARCCRLVPILGNHDEMLLEACSESHPITWFLDPEGANTPKSHAAKSDTGRNPSTYMTFLEGCSDFHETDSHIFVHANYYPDLPMSEQPLTILRWRSLGEMTPGPHSSGKTVILGHSSQKNGEILDLGHLKCIDTYCYGGGWLTALDVQTEEVWQANREGNLRQL